MNPSERREAILAFCVRNQVRYQAMPFDPRVVQRRPDQTPIPWRLAGAFSPPTAYLWELLLRLYGARFKRAALKYAKARMRTDRDAMQRDACR